MSVITSYHPTDVRIRPAEEDDLLACAGIFARSVADLTERYRPDRVAHLVIEPEERLPTYRHILETGAMFVAEDGDRVGFAAAVVRDGVWFLSQLWVLPEHQAGGIGSALLDEALAWGRGSSAFSVIASPHPAAHLLYLRASMFPLWTQLELTGGGLPAGPAPRGLEALEERDGGWVDELDREVRGAARPEDHAWFRGKADGLALWRDGHPRGYVYAWPEGTVGPGAARDPSDLPALLRAARHRIGGPVTVSVPSSNWTALRELVGAGCAPTAWNTFLASRALGDGTRYLSSGGALG
jgi:GNAT superfamily N-acetyltransferase